MISETFPFSRFKDSKSSEDGGSYEHEAEPQGFCVLYSLPAHLHQFMEALSPVAFTTQAWWTVLISLPRQHCNQNQPFASKASWRGWLRLHRRRPILICHPDNLEVPMKRLYLPTHISSDSHIPSKLTHVSTVELKVIHHYPVHFHPQIADYY